VWGFHERGDVSVAIEAIAEASERGVIVSEVTPPPLLEGCELGQFEASPIHGERCSDSGRSAVAILERMDGSDHHVDPSGSDGSVPCARVHLVTCLLDQCGYDLVRRRFEDEVTFLAVGGPPGCRPWEAGR
jgi:hypothetical protein